MKAPILNRTLKPSPRTVSTEALARGPKPDTCPVPEGGE
jgi:hypothetical protein